MSGINQNTRRCALYLRSSKDRTDVSIDAQRRELQSLAKSRNLTIVEEFTDAVESGKDANRPGFQSLIRQINNKSRPWNVVLMVDTSRLARNQYIAHSFMHECRKRGIEVVFAKTPELDGVTGIILPAVLHAMDQVHSFMSREKGLAGMAENIRQGYRAGGRAPFGYRLEYIQTGAIREGEPVTKSKLVPDDNAPKIATYLKGRAQGLTGTYLAEKLELDIARTSLNGIEWNALTYAGHTVWNVHNEKIDDGYKGGTKRRPRSEWLMQRDTHQALITEAEAETILQRLESGKIKTYRTRAKHLLTGMLVNSDGDALHGDGQYYRVGKKSVKASRVDGAVLAQVAGDLCSDDFCKALVKSARKAASRTDDGTELETAQKDIRSIDAKIEKLSSLLAETTATAILLRKIESLEQERTDILLSMETAETATRQARALREIEEKDVKVILNGIADNLDELDRDDMKEILHGLIDRVVFDFSELDCCIHYRIPTKSRDLVASPTRFELVLPP
jgi:DNA invertase Pin-like site-specific DNA recombinase